MQRLKLIFGITFAAISIQNAHADDPAKSWYVSIDAAPSAFVLVPGDFDGNVATIYDAIKKASEVAVAPGVSGSASLCAASVGGSGVDLCGGVAGFYGKTGDIDFTQTDGGSTFKGSFSSEIQSVGVFAKAQFNNDGFKFAPFAGIRHIKTSTDASGTIDDGSTVVNASASDSRNDQAGFIGLESSLALMDGNVDIGARIEGGKSLGSDASFTYATAGLFGRINF